MRVKINASESYNLELPEEIGADEFQALLDRLNQLGKFILKDVFVGKQVVGGAMRVYKRGNYTKEEVIKLLTVMYQEDDFEKRDKKLKEIKPDINLKSFKSGTSYLRNKYNISPKEVGLRRWMRKGEPYTFIKNLRI